MAISWNKGKVWFSERNNGCKDLKVEQAYLVKKLQEFRGAQWKKEGNNNRTKIRRQIPEHTSSCKPWWRFWLYSEENGSSSKGLKQKSVML